MPLFSAFQQTAFQDSPAFQTPGAYWEPHGGRIRAPSMSDPRVRAPSKSETAIARSGAKRNVRLQSETE